MADDFARREEHGGEGRRLPPRPRCRRTDEIRLYGQSPTVRSCCRARVIRCAVRAGRGADQGQAPTPHRALGPAHRVAVPSAGDGQAGHCSAADADQRHGRLPRCRLAGEAACGHRAPVGRKPEGFARVQLVKARARSR